MDPLSIASGAAAIVVSCIKVSTLLYSWIDEIKNIDGTLRAFLTEVNALSTVLDAVKSCSQDAFLTDVSQRQDTSASWVMVHKTLEDCGTVVRELERILMDVASRRGFGQLITNSALNMQSGKIALLRQQIQSYTTVLQMTMQMINVNLLIHNNVSSANASAALSSKMDVLLRYVRRAESSLSRQKSLRSSIHGGRELEGEERGLERLEHCTKMAQRVLSSASTVVMADTQSMQGGKNESYMSIVGSEYGGISDNTRTGIENWILGPAIWDDVEETISSSEGTTVTSTSYSHSSIFSSSKDIVGETTLTIPSSDSQSIIEEGPTSDTNSNQDLELFWVFVRKGDEKYKSQKYAEAERYYHKVLDRSRKLQIAFDRNNVIVKLGMACFEQRKWDQAQSYFSMVPNGNDLLLEKFINTGNRKLDMHDRESACAHFERALAMSTDLPLQTQRDLHSKAGIAYFHQEKWTDAKKHFLAVADVEVNGVSDLRCFEAEHYLAKIHVQENDLDGAENRCLVASSGRRRILGKSHPSWHESIALLVEIYTAKGDPVEADGYAALLPEGYRSLHQRETKFSALCLKYSTQLSKMRDRLLPDRPLGELPLKEIFKDLDNSAGALEAHLRASYSADLLEYPYFQAVSAQMWGELLEDLVERRPHRRSLPLSERPLFTILHLLALLGLEVEAKIWLSISPSHAFLKDGRGNTPFQLAVSGGHVTLASSLLDVPNFRIEARKIPQASLLDLSLVTLSMEPLEFLISQDLIDLTSRYGDQHDTPLMVACRRSNVPAARFLLSCSNLDINERNDAGETALIIATGYGCLEAVEFLLSQRNIDINAQFANFESALSISVKEGHDKVANLLLDEPTLDQEQLVKGLIAATEASRTTIIRKILQTGRVNDSTGNTALLIAARRGQEETVEALLEFDVNMIDENGERILNSAIRRGDTGIVQVLVRAKALDINHNPGTGSREAGPRAPALHLAATLGSAEIVKLLLRNENLDVNQIDSMGLSALHLAVLYAQLPVMETLLACPNVDVNIATTNALKTPLHLAVKTRSVDMVRMLLARPGLKPNEVDSSIRTPLMMTTESRFYSPQLVRALLSDPRLDVNFANAQGDTVLHHAANNANIEVTQDLLQHATTKTDIRNAAGLTPRKIAEKGRDANSRALARLLSRHGTSRELSRWFS